MNSFICSDGTRINKSTLDFRVREAKKKKIQDMIDNDGYVHCEECDRNESTGVPIDCSHTKSVNWCQKNSCAELSWDWVNNFKMLCRICHQKHDKLGVQWSIP